MSVSVTVCYPQNIHRMVQDLLLELAVRLRKPIPTSNGQDIHVERVFVCLGSKMTPTSEKTFKSLHRSFSAFIVVWKKLRSWVILFTNPGISKLRYL
jgi:hypothetical protein